MSGRVLVVEDEAMILLFLQMVLLDQGFDAVGADSADEAVRLLSLHAETLHAVVTDINLGRGGDGWHVARCARSLNPRIPVVYISGHAEGEWPQMGVPDSRFLAKPFTPEALVATLAGPINGHTPVSPAS